LRATAKVYVDLTTSYGNLCPEHTTPGEEGDMFEELGYNGLIALGKLFLSSAPISQDKCEGSWTMPLTITLDDELAGQLAIQANSRNVSVEDLSIQLLREAAQRVRECQAEAAATHSRRRDEFTNTAWEDLNARRLDLIARKFTCGLSDKEAEELERLQEASAAVCEPMDRNLLSTLSQFERRAELDSQ
jgi:hypothetical protein